MARFDGKQNKQVCTSLKLSELSGVNTPAHTGADVTLFKTADAREILKSAAGAIFANALSEVNATEEVERRLRPLFDAKYRFDEALDSANDDAAELGDVERIKTNMREYAINLLAAAGAMGDNTSQTTGADDMTEKELATLKALAEMNDVQKSHYQTLTTDDARDEFVKASATERDGIVETVKSADESYTMSTGSVIKKSVAGESFDLLKSQDERLAKMEKEQSIAKYSAVAETTLKSLPGETLAKAAVLAEIEKMSPAVQTTLNAMLKAGETELAKALDDSTVHVVHGQSVAKGSAHEQIEALVKSYQADNKVDYSKAYSAVMDTPEAQKLYEQMGA